MKVLVDTCVVSELSRPAGASLVRERVARMSERDLYLSVVTVGELAKGVALLSAGPRRDRYADFLDGLVKRYRQRVLTIDVETARLWGEATAAAMRCGVVVGAADGLIAATALRHGLAVMTRNVRDFEHTGARTVNPWASG